MRRHIPVFIHVAFGGELDNLTISDSHSNIIKYIRLIRCVLLISPRWILSIHSSDAYNSTDFIYIDTHLFIIDNDTRGT